MVKTHKLSFILKSRLLFFYLNAFPKKDSSFSLTNQGFLQCCYQRPRGLLVLFFLLGEFGFKVLPIDN